MVQGAGEEVVLRVHPVEFLGRGQRVVESLKLGLGGELVAVAVDEDAAQGAEAQLGGFAVDKWESDDQETACAAVAAAEAKNNTRAKRKAGQRVGQAGILLTEPGERSGGVLDFAVAVVVYPLAKVDAAEVEAEHGRAGVAEAAGDAVDSFTRK